MTQTLDDAPDTLIEQARLTIRAERDEDAYEQQGRRLAWRLFIAFVLLVVVGVTFFAVLPWMGVSMPVAIPVMAFVAIAFGAIMTHRAEAPEAPRAGRIAAEDAARPMGCCSGPGHMRCMKN